jgi:hypothetical protein
VYKSRSILSVTAREKLKPADPDLNQREAYVAEIVVFRAGACRIIFRDLPPFSIS